jgi:hypothetical protein
MASFPKISRGRAAGPVRFAMWGSLPMVETEPLEALVWATRGGSKQVSVCLQMMEVWMATVSRVKRPFRGTAIDHTKSLFLRLRAGSSDAALRRSCCCILMGLWALRAMRAGIGLQVAGSIHRGTERRKEQSISFQVFQARFSSWTDGRKQRCESAMMEAVRDRFAHQPHCGYGRLARVRSNFGTVGEKDGTGI